MIIDIEDVTALVRPIASVPEIEVDEGDGYVTMRWRTDGDYFALIFNGKHETIGVYTPPKGAGFNWKCLIREETKMLEFLEDQRVVGIIER